MLTRKRLACRLVWARSGRGCLIWAPDPDFVKVTEKIAGIGVDSVGTGAAQLVIAIAAGEQADPECPGNDSRVSVLGRRGSKTMTASRLTDLELMDVEIDALFTHDTWGRIIADNEPDGDPAPRFFLGRTREGNRWRVRHDVPEVTARALDALAAAEPVPADLEALPVHLDAMIKVLLPGDKPVVLERDLAYRFPAEIPAPAGATRITHANLQLLRRIVADLADVEAGLAHGDICTAMVVDGVAVSMCSCARLTGKAAEAGVDTLEDYRGRGYAAVVVAAWARAVRETGRIPFYSTSWDNAASQAVARKLGLVQYGVSVSLA